MLKKWIGGWLDDATHNSPQQSVRLNLKKILVAHDTLREQLEFELMGANEPPLSIQDIENSDTCHYGKWLQSVGKIDYGNTKQYKNALAAHTFMFQIAADVVYTHQQGNTKKAKEILSTSFKEASNLNQIELVRLYNLTIR